MVTFVVTAYLEEYDIYMCLGSLLCQKNPNWKAIIYHDGPNPSMRLITRSFNEPRITYKESATRVGGWGCENRIDALNNMVDTSHVVQTSVQDYWSPNAVEEILDHRDYDFVYWNSTHHHRGYTILDCEVCVGSIDWGNFAIKTEIARKVGIANPSSYSADGEFAVAAVASDYVKTKIKIPKVLTIKN